MTQQRAVRTRADLVSGAATEFARYGYAASSVNRILDNTACTKGAMYFHFGSKRNMAEAVLDAAAAVYAAIADRWASEPGVDPVAAITGLVDDAACAYDVEVVLRAETRLSLDPEFLDRRPSRVWETSALRLADIAAEMGFLCNGFSAEKLVRVLAVSLAGCRLLQIESAGAVGHSIRSGYTESLEVVLAAAIAHHVIASKAG